MYVDSLDKIVSSYFATVTREPFDYRGRHFEPKTLRVSPGIFRGYTCPSGCGGCCMRFSLVYLPSETRPESPFIKPREVEFNARSVMVFEDRQDDHRSHSCRHLDSGSGRCGIHGVHPFTCDFELIRTTMQSERNLLDTRLYGRGWAFLRVDGERGALCTTTPPTTDSRDDTLRKLLRLQQWTDHFGLRTWLPEISRWVSSGPHEQPLILNPNTIEL